MVIAAAIGGVAAIGGAAITASAAGDAAKEQRRAAQASAAEQRKAMDYSKQVQDPYLQAGQSAIVPFRASLGIGTPEEVQAAYGMFSNSPDYKYAFDEGMRATQANAKAGGMGVQGGGALKALQARGMGMATQNLSNWRQAVGTLMDTGSSTARALGNQATQTAGNIGDTLTTGAARSSAYNMEGAKAWQGGLEDFGTIAMYGAKYDSQRGKGWF
tara:strand:+ start:819 stop:1463 length:645 start_codon:yes stop_codon:yes gene_type:complete